MQKLMEKKDQTKYKLLKHLQSSEQQSFTTFVLSQELELSESKVSEIVEELILDYSKNFPNAPAGEQLFRNNYNEIIKGPNFSLEPFFKLFIQRSIYSEMAQDLFYDKPIKLEEYAQKRQMSTSTIMRAWRYLKDLFAEQDIHIIKKQGHFTLTGPEEKIRYFFFTLFKDSHKKMPLLVQKHHTNYTIDAASATLTQMKLDALNLMLNISLIRGQSEKMISQPPEHFFILNRLNDQQTFIDLYAPFYPKNLPKNVLEKELNFLFFFANTWTIIDQHVIACSNPYLSPENIHDEAFNLCNTIVFDIITQFKLVLTPNSYFYLIANLTLILRKHEVFGPLINLRGNFSDTDEFHHFSQQLPEHIKQQKKIPLEQLFVLFYPLFNRDQKNIQILLLSRYGFENKRLIEEKISAFLHYSVTFVELLEDNPDLIITDYYYETENIPTFYLIPFPRNKELEHLAHFIEDSL